MPCWCNVLKLIVAHVIANVIVKVKMPFECCKYHTSSLTWEGAEADESSLVFLFLVLVIPYVRRGRIRLVIARLLGHLFTGKVNIGLEKRIGVLGNI